jgi:SdpI/YfhL protein family/Transposase
MTVQLTHVERKGKNRFTAQQELEILREWEATGNVVGLAERHEIHPMTQYRWSLAKLTWFGSDKSGMEGDMGSVNVKTAITLVCLGIIVILVSVPLYLGKIKMNRSYGFRIRKAFESEENWYGINRYGAKVLMWWSVVIMAIGIACLYIEQQSVLTVAKVSFISVAVPIVQTLYYAKRL